MCIIPYVLQGSKENRSIVNVSSTSGLHGNVGQINYAAAKSAVIGLTKTITKEWGPFGVRANTIAFGFVLTRSGHYLIHRHRLLHIYSFSLFN